MPVVQIGGDDPLHDGRQSELALSIQRGMVRHLEALGMAVLSEFPLANGRRADLIALDRKGRFLIVEIKSSIADFQVDRKWPEYAGFCDLFLFATGHHVPPGIFPETEGLYIADDYGAHALREPAETKLAPATRKALTLRFARLAARRAERIAQYTLANLGQLPETEPGEAI